MSRIPVIRVAFFYRVKHIRFPTMTTRIHRLWQSGNPQTRVFLPNFWIKIVNETRIHPPNVVKFEIPMEMTRYDVREYLTKVYKLPVRGVSTEVMQGEMLMRPYINKNTDRKRGGNHTQYIDKRPDEKFAYVTFRKDVKFEFPTSILSAEDSNSKRVTEVQREMRQDVEADIKLKPVKQTGVPLWFSS